MAEEKLKGTHIRLTAYHLTKAKENAKKKKQERWNELFGTKQQLDDSWLEEAVVF